MEALGIAYQPIALKDYLLSLNRIIIRLLKGAFHYWNDIFKGFSTFFKSNKAYY